MEFKPGDKLGFSGFGYVSNAIQIGTYGFPNLGFWWPACLSSFSHVEVIGQVEDQILTFGSTTDNDCSLPCVVTGKRFDGFQAHRIDERIDGYTGRVWHFPLVTPLYRDQIERSAEWLLQHLGTGYDTRGAIECGILSWTYGLRALGGWIDYNDLEWMYCSEAVAAHDSYIGIFDSDNSSLWSPNYLLRKQRRLHKLKKPIRKK